MHRREIKPEIKELLLNAIKKNVQEMSFKPILEDNYTISNLYDQGIISHEDFHQTIEEVLEHVDNILE